MKPSGPRTVMDLGSGGELGSAEVATAVSAMRSNRPKSTRIDRPRCRWTDTVP